MSFRQTAILIGSILVVGVVLLVITLTADDNKPDTDTLTEELAGVKAEQIDILEIEREGVGRLKIERTNANTQPATWEIVEPYRAPADASAVEAVIRAVMSAKPTVDPEPTSNLTARDLDPVGLKVTLRQGTDKSSTVNLGRVTVGGSKGLVYVTTSARPGRPIAVPRSDLDPLFKEQKGGVKAAEIVKWVPEFRTRSIFPGDSRAMGEDVTSLKLELPNKKQTVALSRTPSGRWQFDTPAGWGAADSESDPLSPPTTFSGINPILRTLTSLSAGSAADFITDPGDLKQYGLNPDNPDLVRVEMKTKDGRAVTAFLGSIETPKVDPKSPVPHAPPAGKVHIRVEGQPGVIRASAPPPLMGLVPVIANPAPLRDRNLIAVGPRQSVDGVDILLAGQQPDKPTELRRVGANWKLYGGVNDPQNAYDAAAQRLADAVTARRAIKDFPPPNPANFGAISATLFVWVDGFSPPTSPTAEPVKRSEPIKLEFGRKDGDTVYVRRTMPGNPPQVSEFAVNAFVQASPSETIDLLAAVTKSRLELLDPALAPFSPTEVTRLAVTGQNTYTLERADKLDPSAADVQWRFTAPEPQKGRVADARAVEEMLRLLGTTQSVTRFVDEAPTPEKLTEYGFTPAPRLKVVVGIPSGERVYEFGKDAPDPGFVYARVGGKTAVFTLPRLIFDRLAAPDLRDRMVFRDLPTADATRVELRGWAGLIGKEPIKVVLEKNKAGEWFVPPAAPGAPANAPPGFAPDTAKVNALLQQIKNTRAKTFENGPPESRHGFSEPAQFLEIKVWGPKNEFVWLNIGASPDNGASAYTLTNAVPEPNPIITIDPAPFQPYKAKPTALAK